MNRGLAFFIVIFMFAGGVSCNKKKEDAPRIPAGNVVFTFHHLVDGEPLRKNELIYTNTAGNKYLITEVMYFISDITFYKSDGSLVLIQDWKDIFYINDDIPETKTIRVFDQIPAGEYDSISFIFGISEEKNQSFMYVNPPEVFMAWPTVLGGGYHYMMINGKWEDTTGLTMPFDFHMGIGQLYKGEGYNADSIYAFVQNWFTVNLPGSGFSLKDQDTLSFHIAMNIESWFETPHIYDHNYWGGDIMQKQPAMQMARENGMDVFTLVTL